MHKHKHKALMFALHQFTRRRVVSLLMLIVVIVIVFVYSLHYTAYMSFVSLCGFSNALTITVYN